MKLTQKRKDWAAPRNATLKGTPLRYPVAPAMRYEKSLDVLIRDMRADYQREVLKLFRTVAQDGQVQGVTMDANLGSQFRILFSFLGKKWGKLFADRSAAITERMVASVDKHSQASLGESLKKISGGLTIKVPAMPAGMADVLKASIAENVALITNISSQYQQRVEGMVYRSIQQGGRGAAAIYDDLISIGGMSERRAHLIATDQTRKATSAFNRERAKSVGIKRGIWRHSSGSAEPRRKHVDYDGKEFDLDNPPAIGDKGERVMPGQDVNCHPGDTLVDSFYSIMKLYRRRYSGELLSFVSDDRVILQATPNHPVLTDSGWKAAKLVNKGDHLIHALRQGGDGSIADIENGKATFVEVFDALSLLVGKHSASGSDPVFKFHGDTSDEEIDIVDIGMMLPDVRDASAVEKLRELILSYADANRAEISSLSRCPSALLVMSMLSSSDGVMGGFSSLLSCFGGGSGCLDDVRLRLVSDMRAFILENLPDECSGALEVFGELKFADPLAVLSGHDTCRDIIAVCSFGNPSRDFEAVSADRLGEIVGVDAKHGRYSSEGSLSIKKGERVDSVVAGEFSSSHVYNLETVGNWYLANGMITHNCRCFWEPIVDFDSL